MQESLCADIDVSVFHHYEELLPSSVEAHEQFNKLMEVMASGQGRIFVSFLFSSILYPSCVDRL